MAREWPSDWQGSNWIWRPTRERIYARDDYTCVYCGARKELSLDHLRTRAAGGSHAPWNLVTACLPCNRARGAQPLARFAGRKLARWLQARSRRERLRAERARLTGNVQRKPRRLDTADVPF